jgi:[acyl-carrier-protein] S-malonyltransferase
MAPAGRAFAAVLREQEFRAGHTPVMSSVSGAQFNPDQAVEQLSRQIYHPVEWVATIRALRGAGVSHFDEVNGATLTAFIARIAAQPAEERI